MSRVAWLDLLVVDLANQTRFYEELLGLEVVQQAPGYVELGQGGRKLLGLKDGASHFAYASQAGLFHAAWRLPTRESLGAWLRQALGRGIGLDGASDHGVSQALYLTDPEGNGIEVYWDRPRSQWPYREGRLAMVTEPLDLPALLEAGGDWSGFPSEGDLGHLHLQSATMEEASRFYEGLGFELTQTYPGARFLGMDGYHHQLAVNRWRARRPRDPGYAGLLRYRLEVPGGEKLDPLGSICLCS